MAPFASKNFFTISCYSLKFLFLVAELKQQLADSKGKFPIKFVSMELVKATATLTSQVVLTA